MVEATEDLSPDSYSSPHYDLTHDKPMELEALHAEVVRRATTHGIDVPMTEAVYAILRPWAVRNQQKWEIEVNAQHGVNRSTDA